VREKVGFQRFGQIIDRRGVDDPMAAFTPGERQWTPEHKNQNR
jgi:hypothetical protein